MRILLIAAIIFSFTGTAFSQEKIDRMSADTMQSFTPDTVKWKDEPILPKGAKSVILVGDPSKAGVFIAWLKFPSNYPIPPHTHPFTEVITVLSGKLGNGMGKTFDKNKGEILKAGSSFVLPTGHTHYVWTTDEETIVELIATGPWGIAYTNPDDDPRNKSD
jgi:quercetin dioxygenase-like cupin family protein